MSCILYILADQKYLENSKIVLENSYIFFFQNSGNPVASFCPAAALLGCDDWRWYFLTRSCRLTHQGAAPVQQVYIAVWDAKAIAD